MKEELELPRSGSVWKHTKQNRPMRVIFVSAAEIVAHDAERAHQIETIVSWVGSADDFFDAFEPGDISKYPKTAK